MSDELQPSLFGDLGAPATSGATKAGGRGVSRGASAAGGLTPLGGSLPDGDATPEHARPLAARMRPRSLDEIVGQRHLIGEGRALRRALDRDQVPSMILWGPPGSGKTTLASVIAQTTRARFVALSAVTAGVADLRRVVDDSAKLLRATGQRTILFVDEIHRFSKSQQDAILPHVERGTVTLIGATTENPSFEVNSALLSRCRVFTLYALSDEDIQGLLRRALADAERGLGDQRVTVGDEALALITTFANGDARTALNALELAVNAAPAGLAPANDSAASSDPSDSAAAATAVATSAPTDQPADARVVDVATVEDALQHRALLYDRADEKYNLISALHKSLRGSDPDAGLYWLARMLEAGEDPLYVARRLVRFASEDVGMADPQALVVCMAAQQAVHFIGMPEGALALAQAVVHLATAPKSNALYLAYSAAAADVRANRNDPVPLNIRNAPTRLMRDMDYGKGYHYAHDDYVGQPDPADPMRPPPQRLEAYLPDAIRDREYYQPGAQGNEASIQAWLKRRRNPERAT